MAKVTHCAVCETKITRSNRSDNPECCIPCFEFAGWENEHDDGHHGDKVSEQCPICNPALDDSTKVGNTRKCLCDCGANTNRPESIYLPGHDARHVSQLLRALRGIEDLDHFADVQGQHVKALPSAALQSKYADSARKVAAKRWGK